MSNAQKLIHEVRRETGALVMTGGCYALRRDDGTQWWLEMDRIPLHLLDQRVIVEGAEYAARLISVSRIMPA